MYDVQPPIAYRKMAIKISKKIFGEILAAG
jgi:hypothetical protein